MHGQSSSWLFNEEPTLFLDEPLITMHHFTYSTPRFPLSYPFFDDQVLMQISFLAIVWISVAIHILLHCHPTFIVVIILIVTSHSFIGVRCNQCTVIHFF